MPGSDVYPSSEWYCLSPARRLILETVIKQQRTNEYSHVLCMHIIDSHLMAHTPMPIHASGSPSTISYHSGIIFHECVIGIKHKLPAQYTLVPTVNACKADSCYSNTTGCFIATRVSIGKLLATRRVWTIIGKATMMRADMDQMKDSNGKSA